MFLAGAGVKGGSYYGTWPGLDRRSTLDLPVTTDYRSVLAEVVAARTGASIATVFPGLKGADRSHARPVARSVEQLRLRDSGATFSVQFCAVANHPGGVTPTAPEADEGGQHRTRKQQWRSAGLDGSVGFSVTWPLSSTSATMKEVQRWDFVTGAWTAPSSRCARR